MFESAPSPSFEMTFGNVIERLRSSENVEGIALFGSAKTTTPNAASDYDLLILIREPDVHIFQMHTWIKSISADVVFLATELAERVLEIDEPVSATSPEGFVISWMNKATILYEKIAPNGILTRLQDKISQGEWRTFDLTPREAYEDWFWLNFDLRHIQRLARSTDQIHLMTADIRLIACTAQLCRTYFHLRHLAWTGEKAALQHIKADDAEYFEILNAFLHEVDRTRKVEHCEKLVIKTLAPVGKLWSPYSSAIYLQPPSQHPHDVDKGLAFWKGLLEG